MDRGAWWVIVRGVAIESDMSERLNNHNHLYWKSEDPWLRGFRTMCGGGLLFSIRKSRITSLIRWHLGQVWRQEGESYVVVVQSVSPVRLFATPWTVAYQAPPSMGFSRQEYWSGLPFSSSGDLPNPGIEPGSPALQTGALPSEPPGKHLIHA